MTNIDENIWILITRKLSGEATDEEKMKLQEWLSKDPKNKEYYNELLSSWNSDPGMSAVASALYLFNYDRGLEKLKTKLREDKPVKRINIKSSGKTGRSSRSRIHAWSIAASIAFIAVVSSIFMTTQFWQEPVSASYTASDVEQRIITLTDGSVVHLNKNSKVEILQSFGDETREIRLDGEAFFDVIENPDRPFIIHVGEAVVRVLGTSFSVKQGEDIMVAVKEGLVSFRHKDLHERSAARLNAGQLGLLSKDGHDIKVKQTNVENYVSWMNGYLRFDSMPFEEVLNQLEQLYGVKHELQDSSISTIKLSTYTERTQMEEVLETIAHALNLEYEYRDQRTRVIWKRGDDI